MITCKDRKAKKEKKKEMEGNITSMVIMEPSIFAKLNLVF